MNCIIIEDEPLALERTQDYAGKVPFLDLKASFDNAMDGLNFLHSNPVDLLFLDIHLDELSGIQLLERSKIDAQVIFTTAYDAYALKGYELQVTDYLLKPFTFARFLQAANKAQQIHLQRSPEGLLDYVFVKTENRLEKVNLSEIRFIEGMRDYRRIHTSNKRIMTLMKFSELEQVLPVQQICRVHKSYMVSIPHIDAVERNRIRMGKEFIPISESYRKVFFELIGMKQ